VKYSCIVSRMLRRFFTKNRQLLYITGELKQTGQSKWACSLGVIPMESRVDHKTASRC
jgi:hypothetical protein